MLASVHHSQAAEDGSRNHTDIVGITTGTTVNPSPVEKIILADQIPADYHDLVSSVDTKYDLGINLRELH